MNEFIFIAPEGWTTFSPEQMTLMTQPIGIIQGWAENGNLTDVTTMMHDVGLLPVNQYLIEGRVFNGEVFVARVGTD